SSGNALGSDGGAGFGWNDQTVYKLGVEHQYNNQWTVRAGLNHGEAPYDGTQIDFNIIAPATVETHLTFGATYKLGDKNEVDFGYMHAFSNKITGTSGYNMGTVTHEMDQNALFANYSWKF
ncbi:MAG: outer membrane protein transport protein, partial [Gammaproteobacteria bacterium]|nr:outer membrane protein transport protein [Gammaproteobacteria bacterium]